MKISLTPFPDELKRSIGMVNSHFNMLATLKIQRETAWKEKRDIASKVIAGEPASAEFSAEASLRGIDATALAQLVLSKPDLVAQRELARQTALLALDKAKTLPDLQAILSNLPKE